MTSCCCKKRRRVSFCSFFFRLGSFSFHNLVFNSCELFALFTLLAFVLQFLLAAAFSKFGNCICLWNLFQPLVLLLLLSSASSRSPEHSAVTAVVVGIEPTTLEAFAAPFLSDMSVVIMRSCLTRSGSPVSQSSIIGVTSVNLSVFSLKIILLIPAAPPKFSPKG